MSNNIENKKTEKNEQKKLAKNLKKEKKKKSKVRKVIKIILLLLLIVLIVVGVNFAIKVNKNGGGTAGVVGALVGTDEETLANLPEIYCVLLGQSQNLTDTIMLASYDPKTQEASLLTIPRDTFVGKSQATATAYDKINALCQYTHPEKTVAAVSKITGIDVKNYCLIDTKALVEMVDLIGGVYFDVPIDMDYEDFTQDLYVHVKAGYQLLDGETAEGVVRFRHNQDGTTYPEEYGQEDLGRSRTQRAFLTELANQTLKPQNLLKIGGFIDIFYDNVKTNMNISDIKDYLPYAINFDTSNVKTGIIPGDVKLCNGVSVYIHDKKGTSEIVDELFGNKDDDENSQNRDGENLNTIGNNITNNDASNTANEDNIEKNINIELLNGTENENALFNVKNKLEANGYNIIESDETNLTSKTTIINRNNLNEEKINELEKILGKGIVSTGNSSGKIDITIIIGGDY